MFVCVCVKSKIDTIYFNGLATDNFPFIFMQMENYGLLNHMWKYQKPLRHNNFLCSEPMWFCNELKNG